jgi:hypothetical protein
MLISSGRRSRAQIQVFRHGEPPAATESLELCALSTAVAAKGKFSAAQPFEIPRWVTKIRPASGRRNRGQVAVLALPSPDAPPRRKLAVVSI